MGLSEEKRNSFVHRGRVETDLMKKSGYEYAPVAANAPATCRNQHGASILRSRRRVGGLAEQLLLRRARVQARRVAPVSPHATSAISSLCCRDEVVIWSSVEVTDWMVADFRTVLEEGGAPAQGRQQRHELRGSSRCRRFGVV